LANRESATSWKELLLKLKKRGLREVVLAVSDDHPGLKRAIAEVLPEACWQRCYVHFLRNTLDYLPRKADDDCLTELRWFYERRNVEEARRDLTAWLAKWQAKYPKLCEWVESNIEETFTFYRLPKEHHKHLGEHQCARTAQPGAQTPDPGHRHLSPFPELLAADPGPGGGDPRSLA
jgi:putative transposase